MSRKNKQVFADLQQFNANLCVVPETDLPRNAALFKHNEVGINLP